VILPGVRAALTAAILGLFRVINRYVGNPLERRYALRGEPL
jgi:hypothetical protein